MPPKAPNFNQQPQKGVVRTEDIVQTGCVYCLAEGLQAPAENHVAYMWNGTSFCSRHLTDLFKAQNAQATQPTG